MSPEMKNKLEQYEEFLVTKGYIQNTIRTMVTDARRFALFLEGKKFEKAQRADEA